MGGMRLRTNFVAESRVVTWSCGDRSVSKETYCVAYNLTGVWRITFQPQRPLRQFLTAGLRQLFAWFAGRTAPQCTPCDHSCWNVTNQKCNKPCGFRTNRTCDHTLTLAESSVSSFPDFSWRSQMWRNHCVSLELHIKYFRRYHTPSHISHEPHIRYHTPSHGRVDAVLLHSARQRRRGVNKSITYCLLVLWFTDFSLRGQMWENHYISH